jgi:hypothetical protein
MKAHGLKKIDDGKDYGLTDDKCVVAQLAAQVNLTGPYSDLYIDRRLYWHPKHSALSRAVLGLHEFVYRKARQLGQTDSHNTRVLVSFLITKNLGHSVPTLIGQLISLGFATREAPALSYRAALIARLASQLFGTVNSVLAPLKSPRIPDLITRTNSELAPSHKACEPGNTLRAFYTCRDIVNSVEGHQALKDEFGVQIDFFRQAAKAALEGNYEALAKADWLSKQPGLWPDLATQIDGIVRSELFAHGPEVIDLTKPSNAIPIEDMSSVELADLFARRTDGLRPWMDNIIIP